MVNNEGLFWARKGTEKGWTIVSCKAASLVTSGRTAQPCSLDEAIASCQAAATGNSKVEQVSDMPMKWCSRFAAHTQYLVVDRTKPWEESSFLTPVVSPRRMLWM